MKASRRDFLRGGAFVAAGLLSGRAIAGNNRAGQHVQESTNRLTQTIGAPLLPVETPDLPKLPWQMENGVKVFHLVAEVVKREFLPGRAFDVWGYNGSMPGPTIEVNQGDRVRLIVDNHLPEITTVHWHGFELPVEMDGVPGVTQDPIPPGGRFVYEFTVHQHGTFFYHSHMAMQEMMGMIGLFILHPKGQVSEVQRRQMTTVASDNVFNIAIEGSFDDCQDLLEALFNDAAFRDEMNLSAVNSINWARIMGQIAFYMVADRKSVV